MEQMAEEPQGEHIIDTKTASQFRKELAQNKTKRGYELTSSQREMRERKLEAYDASLKATGKRVCSGKWTEGEEIIDQKKASKLRKELAENKKLFGQGTYVDREENTRVPACGIRCQNEGHCQARHLLEGQIYEAALLH